MEIVASTKYDLFRFALGLLDRCAGTQSVYALHLG